MPTSLFDKVHAANKSFDFYCARLYTKSMYKECLIISRKKCMFPAVTTVTTQLYLLKSADPNGQSLC